MRLLAYLKRQRSLIAENERLRAEKAELREQALTADIRSWVRCPDPGAHRGRAPSPKALLLPKNEASKRVEPHPVRAGRHRVEPVTEVHPRSRRVP